MKKIAVLLVILLFFPLLSGADTSFLKLRASQHPDFLRIVFEGDDAVIQKRLVYQRGQYILVSFPDTNFTIQSEQEVVSFKKINQDTVMFSPGEYRGLKVFTLTHPTRLVIDVYMKEQKRIFPGTSADRRERSYDLQRIETVVIDPGHGGDENGITHDGNKEKNTVLDISKKLGALINRGTSRGYLTRGSDLYMPLDERVKFTNAKHADVFISVHIGNHSGIVIYAPVITDEAPADIRAYLTNKGQADYMQETLTLIKAMKEAVITDFGEGMVSIRPIPHSILSSVEAAAIMVEFPSFEDAYYIEDLNADIAGTLHKGLYIYEEIKTK